MKKAIKAMKIDTKYRSVCINSLIILSFILISVISVWSILNSHTIYGAWDLQFHMRRLLELNQSVKHGFFIAAPAFNYFHGALDTVMYPDLNLYVMLLIMRLVRIKAMTIGIFLVISTFVSLTVGYYSSYSTYHLRTVSYLFTIIYTLSSYLLALYLSNFDIGAITAYTILPMVIFSFINFLKRSSWLGLSTGISLIILNHILSSLIVIAFLLVCFLINVRLIDKKRIKNLVKAIILTVMVTSFFWVPFLYYTLLNRGQIFVPDTTPRMMGYNSRFFIGALHLSPTYYSISIFSFIAVILGAFAFRHFDRYVKQLYVLSVITIVGCSKLFPGGLVARYFPIANVIQDLHRLYVIPQVGLSFIFALVIIRYVKWRKSALFILVILTLSMAIKSEQIMFHNWAHYPILSAKMVRQVPTDSMSKLQSYKIMNYSQLNRLCQWPSYKADYFPKRIVFNKSLVSNVTRNLAKSGHKTFRINLIRYNEFTFQLPHSVSWLHLPLFMFAGEHLSIQIDHHPAHVINDDNQMTLPHVNRGRHVLKINIYHNHDIEYLIYTLTLIGLFIYLTYGIRRWWIL